ncbi:Bgt-2299 [Blumeria graminis f. sp. tritici]|uniref:Bgt-2299 n=2 Tax=Blumeria graminis f. sp. tritici TaxID=62690 RepID=A0A061HJN6_BLUGR|nr:hypothetical protein BGT96224_2299 [Blumeria graminis f. sp. tritici 96224]VDB86019.1 Bgt-2299 [Blumeria graminis f. sp. tritici]
MAPTRKPTGKTNRPSKPSSIGRSSNTKTKFSAATNARTSKSKGPPPKLQKGARNLATLKRKRRIFTEEELDIPALNMITPIGVEKPRGKKKGKIFVDDSESMLTILSMVNAEKEGQIESKMMKARQMEEIREARKAETEKREELRKSKFKEAKDSIRKKRKRQTRETVGNTNTKQNEGSEPKIKSVSFT